MVNKAMRSLLLAGLLLPLLLLRCSLATEAQRWAVETAHGRHEEATAALEARGFTVVVSVPRARVLAVVPAAGAAAGALLGSGAHLRGGPPSASQEVAILSAPGVVSVQPDAKRRRAGAGPRPSGASGGGATAGQRGAGAAPGAPAAAAGGAGASSSGAAGSPQPQPDHTAGRRHAASGQAGRARLRRRRERRRRLGEAPPAPPACPDGGFGDPGLEELVPFSVDQVGALDPYVIAVSRRARDKVLYCILDSGMDARHPDFNMSLVTGATRADGFAADWSEPWDSHGTHAAGSIAALRNGVGVIGVHGEGANLFVANVFSSAWLEAYDTHILKGLDLCLSRLDALKAQHSAPLMRAVASMSLLRPERHELFARKISELVGARGDVLLFAAAGNDGSSDPRWPAALPEVISVAAVDSSMRHARFSQHNADVELCAGGARALSTLAADDFNDRLLTRRGGFSPVSVLTAAPFGTHYDATAGGGGEAGGSEPRWEPLFGPTPGAFEGSPATGPEGVEAELVDCGRGAAACAGAAGRVCLVMREKRTESGQWLCSKVLNCAAGGGVGVLAWPGPKLTGHGDCEAVTGSLVTHGHCPRDSRYPPAVSVSRGQGLHLRGLLAAGEAVRVRIELPTGGTRRDAYGFRSGTSMATPVAAAAAGLVWAAAAACGPGEVRAALAATAKDLGAPGRDELYGWGLVQIRPAIEYLKRRPCGGGGGGGGGGGAAETGSPQRQRHDHAAELVPHQRPGRKG
ncbi:MAG: peptidase S8/S53 domain-containing protein [Monoraphidium minutum]|nr:MAG: peptidase S8/S53 domain-containing protein [Monoraphidium minutum]